MKNLRQRLRKDKIKCLPWKLWKGEIEYLPISAKTLFTKTGIEIDILEKELINEQYLKEGESLLETLKEVSGLYRVPGIVDTEDYNSSFGDFPDDWTEEDFDYYNRCKEELLNVRQDSK